MKKKNVLFGQAEILVNNYLKNDLTTFDRRGFLF